MGEKKRTCTVCGVEGTFKVGYPKYLVLDNDTFYYEASNSQYPKIIAVLDSNGYEIPSKYWTEYHNVSNDEATKRNWIGVTFSGLYSHHPDICTFFNVYPPKINISAISSLNNGINVYWSKGSIKSTEIASGYQIQFWTLVRCESDYDKITKRAEQDIMFVFVHIRTLSMLERM